VIGSIWNNWGAMNAYSAIANRIEARARSYNAQNLIINGDFNIDQRCEGGVNTLGIWGYDRWLNVSGGRQQYVENVASGSYALYWDGGGTGMLGSSSGTSPRQITVGSGNLRVVVPFQAQNVCLIKVNGNDLPSLNPYAPRPMAQELALCQRYYQKSAPLMSNPWAASGTGITLPVTHADTSAGAMKAWLYFPTRMARAPSMSFYTSSGAQGIRQLDEEGENLSITVPATPQVSETLCLIANAITGNSMTRFYQFNYAADAEITS